MGNSARKYEKQAQYKKVLAKRVVIVYVTDLIFQKGVYYVSSV